MPLITAVLGASAGHGALVAPMSDFTVMSRHGSIFTAGPPVVFESMGEQITKEDLGGPGVALASGLIHNVADDEWRAGETPAGRNAPRLKKVSPGVEECIHDSERTAIVYSAAEMHRA